MKKDSSTGECYIEFDSSMFVDKNNVPAFSSDSKTKRMSIKTTGSTESAPINLNFSNGQTSMEVVAEDGSVYKFYVDSAGARVECGTQVYHYNNVDDAGNPVAFNATVSMECVEELLNPESTLVQNYKQGAAKTYSMIPPEILEAYVELKGYEQATTDEGEVKTTLIKSDSKKLPEILVISAPGNEKPYIITKSPTDDKIRYASNGTWKNVKQFHFSADRDGQLAVFLGAILSLWQISPLKL